MLRLRRTIAPLSVHTGVECGQSTIASQRSASRVSAAIPEFSKIGGNLNIKPRSLSLLLPQLGHEPLHLLVERLVILLGRLSTDVPARSEHMPVLANLVQPSA